MKQLYTIQLTRAELEAITLALGSCNGDAQDVEAVYGTRRLIRAAETAAEKLNHVEHEKETAMVYEVEYEINGQQGRKCVRADSREEALRRFAEGWRECEDGTEPPASPWVSGCRKEDY
jgi:hypothetical protein